MPENEKPKLSAELLHQLLGEHVEKAGQTQRRHEQVLLARLVTFGFLAVMLISVGVFSFLERLSNPDMPDLYFAISLPIGVLTIVLVGVAVSRVPINQATKVVTQDLALAAWQLRKVYELASRYEDTGPEIEPALRMGIVLKLGEAQLLLTQLEKFEAKDGRFEHMRSLGPDPLKLQSRGEVRPAPTTGLATTER